MNEKFLRIPGLVIIGVIVFSCLPSGSAFSLGRADLAELESFVHQKRADLIASYLKGDEQGFSSIVKELIVEATERSALGENLSEYVILTPDGDLESSAGIFKKFKEEEGFNVKIHNLEKEIDGYESDPELVRDFLRERYGDGIMRYLLILGHKDFIPMLRAYSLTSVRMYTDYFYADLEGDWDKDGDGVYGEMIDDEIDFIPEFICTRIPCKNYSEGETALENALRYQYSNRPEKDEGILMAGTILVEGESGLFQNIVGRMLDRNEFSTTSFYDTDTFRFGLLEIPLNPDFLHSEKGFPEIWNEGQQGFVYDISHGSTSGVAGFDINEVEYLELSLHGYFVAAACAISKPISYSRNFAEELLFAGGAGGVIGSTDIVNPGEGYRIISGIFAELGFALAATTPDLSMGQAFNIIRVLYYYLFMNFEQDPYWLEMKCQNLKGYLFMGDGTGSLR